MPAINEVPNIHPRKLYELVRACPSSQTRIKAAFQFLVNVSRTQQAFLYMQRASEFTLVESSPEQTSVPSMLEEAQRVLRQEQSLQGEDDSTRTLDIRALDVLQQAPRPVWRGPNGIAYERTVLSVYRDGASIALGVFMWKQPEVESVQPIRQTYLDALCNAFLDAGDAAPSTR